MDWISTTFKILEAGLSLWSNKEASKYSDRILELKRAYYDELKKPLYVKGMAENGNYRSDVVIEHCLRELRLTAEAFATAASRGP